MTRSTRCPSHYPGAATLLGRPIRCELATGHPEQHGHSFAARYWTDDARADAPAALTLWRAWYAMEDTRPEGTIGDPAYDAWTAECARLYVAARAADGGAA